MTGLAAEPRAPVAKPAKRLVLAGWISFAIAMIGVWPLFLASLVIGVILIVRGRPAHGVVLLLLSLMGPMLSLVGAMTLLSLGP
ncbi:MAG TPA: hypothetical protein VE570_01445 [Thermoleophilaceae bacterium]|jgi:uncharacterized RDD family membrane protein YckC|nr:hypothetical protein [Thermoleophilaceae bacterium]